MLSNITSSHKPLAQEKRLQSLSYGRILFGNTFCIPEDQEAETNEIRQVKDHLLKKGETQDESGMSW